ncbi:hypothetical protein [Maledivibacter halophilus]|uniref:Uncharacterized protein n=1 Tax=Maledivibacter halophilus TaxID=36842 RepID=A0A1T5L2R5_9FIRM|nr:hypothetical protein [Maledivibacter halophilus]SKC69995.1 hypothetical protein SAMN02194393_02355 [Maledivibacter halophilus]
MGKRIYNKSGIMEQSKNDCCRANTGCITPAKYDPEVITNECIFVEKVYDAIQLRDEVDRVIPELRISNFPIAGTDIEEFIDVTITCNSAGLIIRDNVLSINGQTTPCDPTFVPGPGGINQINLACVDTSECDAEGKGTPIVVDQRITVEGEVEIKVKGTVLKTDGEEKKFSVSETIDLSMLDPISLRKFARLCTPSTAAATKPSLAIFCGVLCDLILPFGLGSLSVDGNTLVITGPILVFCIICEKKVKVPVQLCVLSTGFCEFEDQGGLCVEFPRLFPEQINAKIVDPPSPDENE